MYYIQSQDSQQEPQVQQEERSELLEPQDMERKEEKQEKRPELLVAEKASVVLAVKPLTPHHHHFLQNITDTDTFAVWDPASVSASPVSLLLLLLSFRIMSVPRFWKSHLRFAMQSLRCSL